MKTFLDWMQNTHLHEVQRQALTLQCPICKTPVSLQTYLGQANCQVCDCLMVLEPERDGYKLTYFSSDEGTNIVKGFHKFQSLDESTRDKITDWGRSIFMNLDKKLQNQIVQHLEAGGALEFTGLEIRPPRTTTQKIATPLGKFTGKLTAIAGTLASLFAGAGLAIKHLYEKGFASNEWSEAAQIAAGVMGGGTLATIMLFATIAYLTNKVNKPKWKKLKEGYQSNNDRLAEYRAWLAGKLHDRFEDLTLTATELIQRQENVGKFGKAIKFLSTALQRATISAVLLHAIVDTVTQNFDPGRFCGMSLVAFFSNALIGKFKSTLMGILGKYQSQIRLNITDIDLLCTDITNSVSEGNPSHEVFETLLRKMDEIIRKSDPHVCQR